MPFLDTFPTTVSHSNSASSFFQDISSLSLAVNGPFPWCLPVVASAAQFPLTSSVILALLVKSSYRHMQASCSRLARMDNRKQEGAAPAFSRSSLVATGKHLGAMLVVRWHFITQHVEDACR